MSERTKGAEPADVVSPSATVTLSVAELAAYEADRGRVLELATQVAELESRELVRQKAEDDAALEAEILTLSSAGKLPPSLHDWARTLSRVELAAWADVAPSYAPATAAAQPEPGEGAQLSDEDKQAARLMGVSIDDFAKHRQAETAGEDRN